LIKSFKKKWLKNKKKKTVHGVEAVAMELDFCLLQIAMHGPGARNHGSDKEADRWAPGAPGIGK
jgi:hypothetical protein